MELQEKHLVNFHLLTGDMFSNHKMDNVACDIEINQTINKANLPEDGCFIDDFQNKYPQLNWKKLAGRKHYYDELNKLPEDEKEKMGLSENSKHIWIVVDSEGNISDSEGLTDAEKSAIRSQLEHTVESLAEEVQKSQGPLPADIDQLIKGFVKPKPKFNYLRYIRNYVGNSTKYTIGSTRLKENQRFEGSPKIVLKPLNRMLVLLDESGSVSEKELYEFLNEIHHLSKKTDIEIRPFDTAVMKPIRYAGKGSFKRTQCGGTSFTAAVNFFNENKEFNSCIIFTDGFAETPPKCNKKLLWVISSNGDASSIAKHATYIKVPKDE